MLRVVVVEDEAWARRQLVAYLEELPGVAVVGEAATGPEGLSLITRLHPDAAFLDIELPGLTGIEVARALAPSETSVSVVFVTAHPQHALAAFQLGAAHYLLKPLERGAVAQALARIQPAQARRWLRIPARSRGHLRLLRPEAVDAIQADLGDCLAWTAEGRLRVEGTLAQWEERLQAAGFLRVHRKALVRVAAIETWNEADELHLATGSLPVSRRCREALQAALKPVLRRP